MADAAVGLRHAHELRGAEGLLVELESLGGALDAEIRGHGVIPLGNRPDLRRRSRDFLSHETHLLGIFAGSVLLRPADWPLYQSGRDRRDQRPGARYETVRLTAWSTSSAVRRTVVRRRTAPAWLTAKESAPALALSGRSTIRIASASPNA